MHGLIFTLSTRAVAWLNILHNSKHTRGGLRTFYRDRGEGVLIFFRHRPISHPVCEHGVGAFSMHMSKNIKILKISGGGGKIRTP